MREKITDINSPNILGNTKLGQIQYNIVRHRIVRNVYLRH